jgi:hypothetical protein
VVGLLTHCQERRLQPSHSFDEIHSRAMALPKKQLRLQFRKIAAVHSGWTVPGLNRSSLFTNLARNKICHHERTNCSVLVFVVKQVNAGR